MIYLKEKCLKNQAVPMQKGISVCSGQELYYIMNNNNISLLWAEFC